MKKSLLRVYLLEDEVLRKVGLNNTFKTLLVSEALTLTEMKDEMIKRMVKGMTSQETAEVNQHCTTFEFFIMQGDGTQTQLEEDSNPWVETQEKNPDRVLFAAPNEAGDGSSTKGAISAAIVSPALRTRRADSAGSTVSREQSVSDLSTSVEDFLRLPKTNSSTIAKLTLSIEYDGIIYRFRDADVQSALQHLVGRMYDVCKDKKVRRERKRIRELVTSGQELPELASSSKSSRGRRKDPKEKKEKARLISPRKKRGMSPEAKGTSKGRCVSPGAHSAGSAHSTIPSHQTTATMTPGQAFGVPLDHLMQKQHLVDPTLKVPSFMESALNRLVRIGLRTASAFCQLRVAPNAVELMEKLNQGVDVDFDSIEDPHTLCSIVLAFFRQLPAPVIPAEHQADFLAVIKDTNVSVIASQSVPVQLGKLVKKLPKHNRNLLALLMWVLYQIHLNSSVNSMDAKSLGVPIGTIVFWRPGEEPHEREDLKRCNRCVQMLIEHQQFIFSDEANESVTTLSTSDQHTLETRYGELVAPILHPDMCLIRAWAGFLHHSDCSAIAKRLVKLFLDNHCALFFVDKIIRLEISRNDDPTTLFRANNLYSHILTFYCRLVALPYLHKLLGPAINEAIALDDDDYEISPSKVSDFFQLEKNQAKVCQLTLKVVDAITESVSYFPKELSHVSALLQRLALEKFGDKCNRNAVIGSLVVLRFISPAIVSPEGWGITLPGSKPRAGLRRGLILVSKSIQNLSNGTAPRENYMAFMNKEFAAWEAKMSTWFGRITSTNGESYPVEVPPTSADRVAEVNLDAMGVLHNNIQLHLMDFDEQIRAQEDPTAASLFREVMILLAALPLPPPSVDEDQEKFYRLTPQLARKLAVGRTEGENTLSSLDLDASGEYIICGDSQGVLRFYSTRSGSISFVENTNTQGVLSVHPWNGTDHSYWVVGRGGVQVYSTTTKKPCFQLRENCLAAIEVSSASSPQFWISKDEEVVCYDPARFQEIAKLPSAGATINCFAVMGEHVWGGSSDGRVLVWKNTHELLASAPVSDSAILRICEGVQGEAWCATTDGHLHVYQLELAESASLTCQANVEAHVQPIAALTRVGEQIWSVSRDGTTKVWSVLSFDLLCTVPKYHTQTPNALLPVWNPRSKKWTVWSCANDSSLCIWTPSAHCGLRRIDDPERGVVKRRRLRASSSAQPPGGRNNRPKSLLGTVRLPSAPPPMPAVKPPASGTGTASPPVTAAIALPPPSLSTPSTLPPPSLSTPSRPPPSLFTPKQ
eukprot:CAMPEP_0174245214 /NCGR_PEP_ID=MMETSP0417-20130205/38001_1 /TAXON_ID=242541 /ORGANISM="Mayorella sp, Strain BSH-02190019" /LENGTH=1265 /DNA_ID=CAMNT_0015324973 /DNA_START=59 /DNA_END=3856 /DNA_ORIENTATION=-